MVTDVNQTHRNDRFTIYTNSKPLCCTPETDIMIYINYASVWKKRVAHIFNAQTPKYLSCYQQWKARNKMIIMRYFITYRECLPRITLYQFK